MLADRWIESVCEIDTKITAEKMDYKANCQYIISHCLQECKMF